MKIPWEFCGGTYQAASPILDAEDAVNCFPERKEVETETSQIAQLRTPGKKKFATLQGELSVPSVFTVNGRTFAAVSNFWEVPAGGGAATNWGSLGSVPVRPTMITANQTQVVVLNNGNLYVFTLATNVLAAVNMAQFNGPISQIAFVDGYIIATLQNSHTFQQSKLGDATVWSGLDISTISYFPDNLVSMITDHRELWFQSAKKTIGYYNSGAGFPVFIPIQGAEITNGSCAAFAIQALDNSVMWIDQDEQGFLVARRLNGYKGQRISTHATELAWQQYAVSSDAVGWTYQENGHLFWMIYFPAANITWGYDVATGFWHKRMSWNQQNGTYGADRAMCHTFNFGKHLVGDPFSGTIYDMSSKYYDDDGAIIRGYRRSPTQLDDNKRVYYSQLELILDAGLETQPPLKDGNGQPRPPQIMLRWSDNAGKRWSNTYLLSCGLPGQDELRVVKRMLGKARKRVWEVAWTDPYPFRFVTATLEGEAEAA